jgi:uncharacterized protein (TIGR03437 family)
MSTRQLYMLSDDLKTVLGQVTAGTNLALQNSQCGLDVSAFTATSSGNSMQLTFPMVFWRAGTWSIQVNLYNLSKSHSFAFAGSWNTPQRSCSYSLAPPGAMVSSNATAGTIVVAADSGCPWLASANQPWITITSAVGGTGGGAVSYAIAANASPAPRNGAITVAGQNFSVSQSVTSGAGPAITSVVNGASFRMGLASSTWITIQGTNLAPATRSLTGSDFAGDRLPTQLAGVSVSVNGKPAYVYYVSPNQVNVLAPDDDSVGPVPVEIDTPNGRSAPLAIQKQQTSPALFPFDPGGRKYAAAVYPDGTYVGPASLIPGVTSRPALPGDVILLFGTGFGLTNPVNSAAVLVGQPAALSAPVTMRIGNVVANVAFAGLVSSGLYQFNVTVPDLPAGDQKVTAEIGGIVSQDNLYIAVGK